jgi:hypothetical protein
MSEAIASAYAHHIYAQYYQFIIHAKFSCAYACSATIYGKVLISTDNINKRYLKNPEFHSATKWLLSFANEGNDQSGSEESDEKDDDSSVTVNDFQGE